MSSSVYKNGFPAVNTETYEFTTKSMGCSPTCTVTSAPEAHSHSTNLLSNLAYIPNSSNDVSNTAINPPKFSPFSNASEIHGFGECFPSQGHTIPDQMSSSSSPMPSRKRSEKPPAHVKKPLNAFMLFMKEMRAKVVAECTMKESAAINQILGRKWHALPHEEQAKFYEMARKEKELHQKMYPGWSARDNYAYHAKRRKNRCRYRVYNNSDSLGEQQQKQAGESSSPPSSSQEAPTKEKSSLNLSGGGTLGLEGVFKNTTFNRSPFTIGNMAYGVGEQCCNSTKETVPYFNFMDRNQQPNYQEYQQSQSPFFLNSGQLDF